MIFIQAMLRWLPTLLGRWLKRLDPCTSRPARVRIPGFYDAVQLPTETERRLMARFPIDTEFLR
jgi:hypothetical protein